MHSVQHTRNRSFPREAAHIMELSRTEAEETRYKAVLFKETNAHHPFSDPDQVYTQLVGTMLAMR